MKKLKQNKIGEFKFGMYETLDTLAKSITGYENPYRENKDDVLRYEANNLIIDTCIAYDTDLWETGLNDSRYYDNWIIIEQYQDKEEAKIGHDKWVKIFTGDDLPQEIDDVLIEKTYKFIKKGDK